MEKPDVYIGDYNLKNIVLKKNRKNYSLYEFKDGVNRVITIKLTGMKIPFGVEKYGYKELINFEFLNKDKYNNSLNNYNKIKQIDSYFRGLKDFNDKYYKSCIKERDDYDPLLRVHLKKRGKNILTTIQSKNNTPVSVYELKNALCCIELELQSLWTTDDSFGLLFCVKNIKLLN